MYLHTNAYMDTYVNKCKYAILLDVYMFVCVYVNVFICIYMYICTYVYMFVYVCIYSMYMCTNYL